MCQSILWTYVFPVLLNTWSKKSVFNKYLTLFRSNITPLVTILGTDMFCIIKWLRANCFQGFHISVGFLSPQIKAAPLCEGTLIWCRVTRYAFITIQGIFVSGLKLKICFTRRMQLVKGKKYSLFSISSIHLCFVTTVHSTGWLRQ